jgi:restriction system protein
VPFRRAGGICASVVFIAVLFLAVAASANAACWASDSTGRRAYRNFYGAQGHIIVDLCEDQPGNCLKLADTALRPTRYAGAHLRHRRVSDSHMPAAPEANVEVSSQVAPGSQEPLSDSGLLSCLGIVGIITGLVVGIFAWWKRGSDHTSKLEEPSDAVIGIEAAKAAAVPADVLQTAESHGIQQGSGSWGDWSGWSRGSAIKAIRDNAARLAIERNEELYGFWWDTIPDQDELEERRDACPGQEPKLTRAFQIDAAEPGALPQGIKLDIDYSALSADEPDRHVQWRESKRGFLLYEGFEPRSRPKWPPPLRVSTAELLEFERGPEWLTPDIEDLSAMIDHEAGAYLARKHPEFQLAVFMNAIRAATTFQMACEMSKWFIRQHARNLAVRRSQLISKDIYGLVDSTKWQQEKRYFFSKVMLPALGFADDDSEETNLKESKVALFEAWHLKDDMPIDWWISAEYKDSDRLRNLSIEVLDGRPRDAVYSWRELFSVECRRLVITEMVSLRLGDLVSDWIEQEVAAFASRGEEPSISSVDGHEYEEYCAGRLRDAGWETRYTPKSGDQGVDIIAERDGIRVAIQCKNYKQPVGNKAVQEVLAGKSYERADFAAVVSPASYTPAATKLASATGVLLLHHKQLPDLARLMHEIKERSSS